MNWNRKYSNDIRKNKRYPVFNGYRLFFCFVLLMTNYRTLPLTEVMTLISRTPGTSRRASMC